MEQVGLDKILVESKTSLYERMKERGINMSWYERNKGRTTTVIPLDDDMCGFNSIYLLKENGSLWTLKGAEDSIQPHAKVRDTKAKIPKNILVCVKCRKQWNDLKEARSHGDIIPT